MCDVVLHVVSRLFIDPGLFKEKVPLCKRYALFFLSASLNSVNCTCSVLC